MPEYDLVIRGGTVVDGTRLPAFKADVAIAQGRIARISGTIAGRGRRELDASGCIVAPGAVDLHTHYDAQLNWDPYCTLSGWHGVTTLTIGQCGFGFAPCKPEDRELNMRMMSSRSSGLQGAKPKPHCPIVSVVTPCQPDSVQ